MFSLLERGLVSVAKLSTLSDLQLGHALLFFVSFPSSDLEVEVQDEDEVIPRSGTPPLQLKIWHQFTCARVFLAIFMSSAGGYIGFSSAGGPDQL